MTLTIWFTVEVLPAASVTVHKTFVDPSENIAGALLVTD
jgi:hypothetical protein